MDNGVPDNSGSSELKYLYNRNMSFVNVNVWNSVPENVSKLYAKVYLPVLLSYRKTAGVFRPFCVFVTQSDLT